MHTRELSWILRFWLFWFADTIYFFQHHVKYCRLMQCCANAGMELEYLLYLWGMSLFTKLSRSFKWMSIFNTHYHTFKYPSLMDIIHFASRTETLLYWNLSFTMMGNNFSMFVRLSWCQWNISHPHKLKMWPLEFKGFAVEYEAENKWFIKDFHLSWCLKPIKRRFLYVFKSFSLSYSVSSMCLGINRNVQIWQRSVYQFYFLYIAEQTYWLCSSMSLTGVIQRGEKYFNRSKIYFNLYYRSQVYLSVTQRSFFGC